MYFLHSNFKALNLCLIKRSFFFLKCIKKQKLHVKRKEVSTQLNLQKCLSTVFHWLTFQQAKDRASLGPLFVLFLFLNFFLNFSWHDRRNYACSVGRCNGFDTPLVCQWLRQLHHHRLGQVLAHGLPERERGHQDGHRALQRSHPRPFHGKVSSFMKRNCS